MEVLGTEQVFEEGTVMIGALQIVSAICAGIAAYYWWRSAVVKLPKAFAIHVVRPDSFKGQLLGGALGGEMVGHGYSEELNALGQAFGGQSMLRALGARWAGAAAAMQAVLAFLPR